MKYQSLVLCQLEQIMNSCSAEQMKERGSSDLVKLMIRHYPEMLFKDGRNIATYRQIAWYKKHFKITARAKRALMESTKKGNEACKDVFYEHIVPVSQTFQDLVQLKSNKSSDRISKAEIENVLSECEVVIISREEQTVLDGSTSRNDYTLDGMFQCNGLGFRIKGSKADRFNALETIGAVIFDSYDSSEASQREH